MSPTIVDFPNSLAAFFTNEISLMAAELRLTLSAPFNNIFSISPRDLMPPPTVKGTNNLEALCYRQPLQRVKLVFAESCLQHSAILILLLDLFGLLSRKTTNVR